MTDALERLRPDWTIRRDDAGYHVYHVVAGPDPQEGEPTIRWLARGDTLAEAVASAEAVVADAERREAERRADYERRKAAGLLTDWELLNERIAPVWSSAVPDALRFSRVLSTFVDRTFERELGQLGTVVSIPKRSEPPP